MNTSLLKIMLEKKIGKVSEESFLFAVSQLTSNNQQVHNERILTRAQILDELSTSINFYYDYIAPKEMRKRFVYREISRYGGNLERAYLVSRENIRKLPSKEVSHAI